jgi:hypothetical protein
MPALPGRHTGGHVVGTTPSLQHQRDLIQQLLLEFVT